MELAVSFVVLLLLLGGAVDFGRAFFAFVAIRDAAQEGAVYGSLYPNDTNGIDFRIRHSSDTPIDMTNTSDVLINITKSCCQCKITVQVTYNFRSIMPLMNSIFGSGIFPIPATVTNTILSPNCN